MAPRKRGTQVDPPPPGPEGDVFEDDMDEEEDAERARLGDLVSLADASFADYTWHVYRHRSAEEMARTRARQQSVFATTFTGPVDLAQLRATVGGGVFTLWGYLGGKLARKIRFEMEGPPIYYAPPAAATTPPPAASPLATIPNGTDPVLLGLLSAQQKTLDAIAAAVTRPQQPAGFTFREALAFAQAMGRGGGGGGGVEMKDLVALFEKGIEIGGAAVGGNEKSTLETVLEKGIPALERIAVAMSRRQPPRPPQPRPKPASGAVVVEDPTPNPAAPEAEPVLTPEQREEAVRWNAAVAALARAIESGADPDDFGNTLEDLLLPVEVDMMLAGGTAAVMEQLRKGADRYPILDTPGAESFVDRVLTSLANPEPTA